VLDRVSTLVEQGRLNAARFMYNHQLSKPFRLNLLRLLTFAVQYSMEWGAYPHRVQLESAKYGPLVLCQEWLDRVQHTVEVLTG
jgi:hypothetical protein